MYAICVIGLGGLNASECQWEDGTVRTKNSKGDRQVTTRNSVLHEMETFALVQAIPWD